MSGRRSNQHLTPAKQSVPDASSVSGGFVRQGRGEPGRAALSRPSPPVGQDSPQTPSLGSHRKRQRLASGGTTQQSPQSPTQDARPSRRDRDSQPQAVLGSPTRDAQQSSQPAEQPLERSYNLSDSEHAGNLAILSTWDFSVWDFQKPKLVRLAMSIFHAEGLLQTFGIPAQQFVCFMEAVLDSSGGHPYHNMYHSMAVLHGCWYMVELHKDRRLFTPLEKLALFTAGLGMNLDHPGLTNSYMCASGHDLALRYNDMSVAEQHCTSCLFVLLRDPACNILCNVSPSEFRGIRTIIIGAIIHTDPQASATFNPFAHSSRHASQLGLVLDAAVCATAIKPWAIYKHFSNDLQAELDAEVRRRALEGVPTTASETHRIELPQAERELHFINQHLQPSLKALLALLPNLQGCLNTLERNKLLWHNCLEAENTSHPGGMSL